MLLIFEMWSCWEGARDVGLRDGQRKKVSQNFKKAGEVEKIKGKKEFKAFDANGKEIGSFKNERLATEHVRKNAQREQEKKRGGGVPGVSPRPEGHGKSPAKRAANRAARDKKPGSGLNPHLWKNVNSKDK